MATQEEIQKLLRFMTTSAGLSLPVAMSKVKALQKEGLITVAAISACDLNRLNTIYGDEKTAKKVLNAAKRQFVKRGSASGPSDSGPPKKRAKITPGEVLSPAALEESLALPELITDEEELSKTVLFTNRAPLVLAFAVMLLKYTMPEQPLSSRLSLAQAVVSVNSRSKAVSLGLESGKSAEEEGWGEGQPTVRVMNREIRTMRRWGYDQHDTGEAETQPTQSTGTVTGDEVTEEGETEPSLWGVDLEALKTSSIPSAGAVAGSGENLPIYTPQSARSYLLRAFEAAPDTSAPEEKSSGPKKAKKKQNLASKNAEKERNLGLLLGALDLVYQSWANTLDKRELDRRAWGWYVRVRPEVESGVAGWGGKGDVKLAEVLKLRREG